MLAGDGVGLVERGAAVMVRQNGDLAAALKAQLSALVADRARLESMGTAALRLARPDAAERVADAVLEVAK